MQCSRRVLHDADADRLAERLTLTEAQKALLKGWQDVRQKAREDARTALCTPKPDLSTFAGRLDWRGKRLETQLATFKAERPKIEIAARVIRAVNPDARIVMRKAKWQEVGDLLKGCDIIVGGLDHIGSKDELEAFCRRFMIPYLDMGMDVTALPGAGQSLVSGQVVLSMPGQPCLWCLQLVTD